MRSSSVFRPAGLLALPLLLVVSGCGSSAPGASGLPMASPSSEALAAWASFPAHASPRPLVLVGPSVDDPADGFTTGALKGAYLQGQIAPPTSMPSGPSTSEGFPLISAADAFHRLSTPTGHIDPPVSLPPLVTTAVHLGSATFQTDRGPRELPAWMFSFANVANPASVLAVAPTSIFSPKATSTPSSDFPSVGAVRVGDDGKTLTADFVGAASGTGPCTADYSLLVTESQTAVLVQVEVHPHAAPPGSPGAAGCAAIGYPRHSTASLNHPIGPRVVVDAASGQPVAVTASS